MGLFNSSFGNTGNSSESSNNFGWIQLTDLGQLNEIIQISHQKPVIIFKHSTRCSISKMALRMFEREYNLTNDEITTYFLDLIAFRAISNEIASRFEVVHQSPQLILIVDGKSIYNVSHSDIDALELKAKI